MEKTDAEREVVREGLASLGRIDEPTAPDDLLCVYARKIGSVLGFTGLVLIGSGVFGLPAFRYIGFGLVLAGFGLIAGAEFGPALKSRLATETEERAA